ncbi:hypothetical protein ACET3X_000588 [Alternaria dauci]|uniref:Uncharacterized protein n=1 Tax=Alternaria dauci TaxID=48095 RepID=A0ABR3UUU6_9PLEO
MSSSHEQDAVKTGSKSTPICTVNNSEAAKGADPTHHQDSSLATDVADDSADEYQPDDHEVEDDQEDASMMDTPKITHTGASHTMNNMDKEAKQRHSDEQVGFIIMTRDNNQPDAYGATSETHGPLSWPTVAKAYNEKYKLSVGPAAMEKRARQHRSAWMEKHPTYPTSIVYTKKSKPSQGRHSAILVVKPHNHRVQGGTGDEEIRSTGDVGADELQTAADPFEDYIPDHRIGGWMPPDDIRNETADLDTYLDQLRSTQTEEIVIKVVDAQDVSLGTVTANREDLGSSAVLQRLMNGNASIQVQLDCCDIRVVQWYVRCVSSKGLAELPADLPHDNGSLIHLYCFAAQLEDDWVRELILAHWRRFAESNAKVSLDVEDLNLFFKCTCSEDPARRFWATTVRTAGLAAQFVQMDECSVDLIAEIQDMVARAPV